MSDLLSWLEENKLMEYKDKFEEEAGNLNNLSCDTLEDDKEIMDFIAQQIGETKKLKQKTIFKAIKRLQAKLSEENDEKENKNMLAMQASQKGYNISHFVGVTQEKEINIVVKNNTKLIVEQEKQYYEINVREAMTKLATCGKLIQLAYVSTNGFKCQSEVVKLLSKYQTLVKNSYIASTRFVTSSFIALNYHKIALDIVLKKPEKSIEFVMKCSKLAGKMSVLAGALCEECEKLASVGENALVEAVKDKNVSVEEREKIQKEISEAKAAAAKLEKSTQLRAKLLKEIKEDEAKAIKDANEERAQQFMLEMTKTIMAPLTGMTLLVPPINVSLNNNSRKNNNNSNNDNDNDNDEKDDSKKPDLVGKSADNRAYLLTQEKYKMQDALISQNAELAKTVSQLKSYKGQENKLQRGLKSIEIAIKTLGKIKVIFSNTQLFWEGVEANCDRLAQIGDDVKLFSSNTQLFKNNIRDSIMDSGLNWFTLCKVNYDAKQAIIHVDKGMDEILNNLPDENEAILLVDQLSNEMIVELENENKQLKQSTSSKNTK